MKKLIFLTILILTASALPASAQKIIRTQPTPVTPRNVPFKTVTEISDADWQTLASTLQREDWKQSASLAAQHLGTLKTENDKKQLAQLRYLYLYSLAGQVLVHNTFGNAAEAKKVRAQIDTVLETMLNKEFMMPARPFATDCGKKLNVVCQVKDQPDAFRTTATNKEGSGIHSFDYVQFDQSVSIKEFDGKQAFLGGILRRVEFNEDKTKPWVLRLFFNKGFLTVVVK